MKWLFGCALAAIIYLSQTSPLFADRVLRVGPEDVIQLESGRQVKLAGLDRAPEAESFLRVLLSGKDVEIKPEDALNDPSAGSPESVYLFVETTEIPLPFAEDVPSEQKHVMVNELLLAFGIARVDSKLSFPLKEQFLAIEEKARNRGEGIWSYNADKGIASGPSG